MHKHPFPGCNLLNIMPEEIMTPPTSALFQLEYFAVAAVVAGIILIVSLRWWYVLRGGGGWYLSKESLPVFVLVSGKTTEERLCRLAWPWNELKYFVKCTFSYLHSYCSLCFNTFNFKDDTPLPHTHKHKNDRCR